jgi:hypothetical protein
MALLLREHSNELLSDPAFCNGVRSALTIWRELQAEDPALQKVLDLLPPRLSPPAAQEIAFGALFRYWES